MDDESNSQSNSNAWLYGTAIAVTVVVAIAWATNLLILKDVPERGTFGDMFGAVNSLFSGLAFVGVVFAILLQGRELQLQRKELHLTRAELSGQKIQLEEQTTTLQRQAFENTFFQLLSLLNEVTSSIDLEQTGRESIRGRDCFNVFYSRFRSLWAKDNANLRGSTELERIRNTYMTFNTSAQAEIGHYFRTLYHTIKFVDNAQIDDKATYTNFVRAQLSSHELVLLFYNCLSPAGDEKFKPLVERYALLKTVPKNQLINVEEHMLFYNPSAFGLNLEPQ